MKYYKTVTVTKQVEIPFREAREIIIWTNGNNKQILLSKIDDKYLRNIIKYLQADVKHWKEYKGITLNQWIETFEEEMRYRELYISYNEFKRRYLK
jgi:hypothetical protein